MTVTTIAELNAAIDSAATSIHLNAASFTLTASKTIDYAMTLDVVYTGDVTINGNDTYGIIFNAVNSGITIMGSSDRTKRLIFTKGAAGVNAHSVQVGAKGGQSLPSISFQDVDFTDAKTNCGLNILNAEAVVLTVNCTNCKAYLNPNDGFAINNAAGTTILTLTDCNGYSNSSQGATCHNNNEFIKIIGGKYYSNEAAGIGIAGGDVSVWDAEIYNNVGNAISMTTGAKNFNLYMDGVKIYDVGTYALNLNTTGFGNILLYNCDIDGTGATGYGVILVGTRVSFQAVNCAIYNFTAAAAYGILFPTGGILFSSLKGCTINHNTRNIRITSRNAIIVDCIISNATQYGIDQRGAPYYQHSISGNNIFYNNAINYFHITDDGSRSDAVVAASKSTDRNIDPKFMDAVNADFNHDGIVNFYDFAVLADQWLTVGP